MQEVERKLYRYGELIYRIKETEEEIREQAASKIGMLDALLRPARLDTVRVQGGEPSDPVGDIVQRMVDVYDEQIKWLQQKLREFCFEKEALKKQIGQAGLNQNEMAFMELRYVKRMKICDIAAKMSFCESFCYKLRLNILKKMRKTSCDF